MRERENSRNDERISQANANEYIVKNARKNRAQLVTAEFGTRGFRKTRAIFTRIPKR